MSESEEKSSRRFELLLLDYEMARDDERSALSAQATMFGIGVALLAILLPLLTQTCALNPDKNCTNVPVWVVAAAPMAPFGTIAFLVSIGVIQTIRGYYIRAVEMELQQFAKDNMAHIPVSPASLVGIVTEVVSLRRGRSAFRLLMFIVLAAATAIFGGMTLYIIIRLPPVVAIISGAIYGSAGTLVLVEILRASIGGRGLFVDAVRGYLIKRGYFPEMLPQLMASERSLVSYLLLPRPRDVVKWFIVIVTYGYGLLIFHRSPSSMELARVGLLFFAFEYLIYEARYQWNDIRGLASDVAHPGAKHRLPAGSGNVNARRNVIISELVIVARIASALALSFLLGGNYLTQSLILLAIVVAVAIVYEWLRSRRAVGGAEFEGVWSSVAIWILVGLGYALRGMIGLVNAGINIVSWAALLAAFAFAAFGVVFVTMTWSLDASSYCYQNPAGAKFDYAPELLRQPQLASLLPFLDGIPGSVRAHGKSFRGFEAKVFRSDVKLITPWHIGLLCAAAFAAAFGADVALSRVTIGSAWAAWNQSGGWVLICACAWVVGLAATLPAILFRRSLSRWLSVLGAAALSATALWPAFGSGIILVVLPWLLFLVVYLWFRDQSWATLQVGLRPLARWIGRLVQRGGVAFVGEQTAALIAQSGGTPPNVRAGRG